MALALAMDCFAVAIASGIIFKRVIWKPVLTMAFLFGFFQALNPLLGWWGADLCREAIECIDHWIAFAILGFLGARMVIESFKEEEKRRFNPRSYKAIFTLAIATSIDALAVGISLAMAQLPIGGIDGIFAAVLMIGLCTCVFSACGVKIGNVFGSKFEKKAQILGGVILILLGTKILLEHLGILP